MRGGGVGGGFNSKTLKVFCGFSNFLHKAGFQT